MRFHHNTCLYFFDRPITLSDFTLAEDWQHHPKEYQFKFALEFIKGWNGENDGAMTVQAMFGGNVRYITIPFYKAYMESRKRLKTTFADEPIEESGTLISNLNHGTETTFYYVKTGGNKDDGTWHYEYMIAHFTKMKEWDKPQLQDFCTCLLKGDTLEKKSYISEDTKGYGEDEWGTNMFLDIFFLLLFLKYCDLETKVIAPGKKDKHVGDKYLNETKHKIQILNSTWFTTIIRSEGFGVTGHFRLQPYGPGLKERKLIYIAPFEKHGYTRKATVLNETVPD